MVASPEDTLNHVKTGELAATLPSDHVYFTPGSRAHDIAIKAVQDVSGGTPPSGRCCVVDPSGMVVDVIQADPDLDAVAGHTLISSDIANVGWTVISGVLVAPLNSLTEILGGSGR